MPGMSRRFPPQLDCLGRLPAIFLAGVADAFAEEREARRPREMDGVPAEAAVRYLRELSATWRKADGGPGRRMLAEVLFSRVEVLGGREATIHLTEAALAHGFAAVIPDRLDVTVGYGRGERI